MSFHMQWLQNLLFFVASPKLITLMAEVNQYHPKFGKEWLVRYIQLSSAQ